MPPTASDSSEDEEWSPTGDTELIPGFEKHEMISNIELDDDDETCAEYFLARDKESAIVSIIKVDHDNEESIELDGKDCNALRKRLCALQGIDADMDQETAAAVFSSQVGEIPAALKEYDSSTKVAPVQKKGKKRIAESDDEDDCANAEREEKKPKVVDEPSAKKVAKKKKAVKVAEEKQDEKKEPKKIAAVFAAPKKNPQKKKTAVEKPTTSEVAPKEETTAVAEKQSASKDTSKQAPPKRKQPAKRKKPDAAAAPASILNFVKEEQQKQNTPVPAQQGTETFKWQLILNGQSISSLRAALSQLPK